MSVRDWSGPYSSAGSVFSSALNANPVDFPIRFPGQEDDTHIRWGGRSGAPNGSYVNPVADFVSGYSSTYSTSVTANLRFNQDLKMIMKGLKLNAIVSYYNYSYSKVYRYCNVNQYETSMYNPQEDTYDLNIIGNEQVPSLKPEVPIAVTVDYIYKPAWIITEHSMTCTKSMSCSYIIKNRMTLTTLRTC